VKNINVFLRDIFGKWMKKSLNNRGIVFVIDVCICLVGYLLSVLVPVILPLPFNKTLLLGLFFLAFIITSFYLLKSYQGLIRHSNFRDIWRIFVSLLASCLAFYIVMLLSGIPKGPAYFFILNVFLFCFFLILGFRLVIVFVYNRIKSISVGKRKKTIIYGIGPHSLALANWINRSSHSQHVIQGFISRDKNARKTRILDMPVFFLNGDNLDWFFSKHEITTIIFPSYQSVKIEQEFITACVDMGVSVLVSPPLEGIETSGVTRIQMKPIQFEDLLGREEIKIDMDRVARHSGGKTILITGAAGSIGTELVRQLTSFNPKLMILFDMAETPLHNLQLEIRKNYPHIRIESIIGDIRSESRLEHIFRNYHPNIVYHAAAYKHVSLMEENPCEAVLVNILGTKRLCDISDKYDVECFVMISTDKAVNPVNVMGASKRMAEIYLQSMAKKIEKKEKHMRILITRFGNVLGSNGSVIPRFRKQIENGGPVTVTHPDIYRYFMTIPEACRLILEASSFGNNGDTYIFDMGRPLRIAELAKNMIELAGYTPETEIQIVYTGLRPGEKLNEELLNDRETMIPTDNEKITVARGKQYDYESVLEVIDQLVALSKKVEIDNTIRLLKSFLTEFKSQNSPFQKFD
jgi:FlaA1/EpsC-like NDP-sugar epimerase